MWIARLEARHVRNLKRVGLEPDSGLNVVAGENASGKTSLLEAIHLLGAGRSFRTTRTREVVEIGSRELTVFARVRQRDREHRLGIAKDVSGVGRIQIDGQRGQGAAELAERLAVVAIGPESTALIGGPPQQRRGLLDWGVFHVEHGFLGVWRNYTRALKQRNAALRGGGSATEYRTWDAEVAKHGEGLSGFRREYVEALKEALAAELEGVLPGVEAVVSYEQGWRHGIALGEALAESRGRDEKSQYTNVGPHRGDLRIVVAGRPAAEVLSRGQQKLLVYGLRLAQLVLLKNRRDETAVLLLDDLAAELDEKRRQKLLERVASLQGQVFVTTTAAELIPVDSWPHHKLFHVEQGCVTEVV